MVTDKIKKTRRNFIQRNIWIKFHLLLFLAGIHEEGHWFAIRPDKEILGHPGQGKYQASFLKRIGVKLH